MDYKWSSEKDKRALSREHVGHNEQPFPTNQEMTLYMVSSCMPMCRVYTKWDSAHGLWFWMVNIKIRLIMFFASPRWKSSIQSAKIRPGADCASNHQLLTAKFRLKLKKIGKTTRPFRYDLNQIPYDSTVEVTNRFKGLDLGDKFCRTRNRGSKHCTGGSEKSHPK